MRILLAMLLPISFVSELICSAAFGAVPLVDVERYAERSQQERPAATPAAKAELARVRKNRRLDKATKEAEVNRLETIIADLENPLLPYYAEADFTLGNAEIGNVGRLSDVETDVFQVAGGNDAIIVTEWHFEARTESAKEMFNRIQSAAASSGSDSRVPEKMLWLSGVSTRGTQNGGKIKLAGLFAVTGNRTYQTLAGTNTILVIEPFDVAKYADKFTRKSEVRTWTSKGGHTTEAIFVRTEKGSATLMKPDGKTIDVELEKLSDADRDYVRKYVSKQAKLANSAKRRR